MSEQFADISGWQAVEPDLSSVDGVIIKSTEGTGFINPRFKGQIDFARSQGKELGLYHFADGADPIAEADYFVDNSAREDGVAQALDVEGDFYKNVSDPVGWCLAWLQHVESRTNNKPGIYLSQSELASYDWSRVVKNDNWLWIAEWNGQNQPQITQFSLWTLWQYADKSATGGDADIFNGDVNVWKKIAANEGDSQDSTPVPPAPSDPVPAPVPAPEPAPSQPVNVGTFLATVSSGDTMTSIANQFNVTLAALEAVNPGIQNFDQIQVDQVINIPGNAPVPLGKCVVSEGDTMSTIADQVHTSLAALEAANPHIANYDLIYVGQTLNLPEGAHF